MSVKNITPKEYIEEEFERARKARKKWANREGCREEYNYCDGYCNAMVWTRKSLDFFREMWDLERRMDNAK